MSVQINLNQTIYSLAEALDLVGVDQLGHGKRVSYMAAECAALLGREDLTPELALRTGILHDCGVSSTRMHQHLVTELDWDGAERHCRRGFELLQPCAPFADLALPIRYHHTHWSALARMDLDPVTQDLANLIFLVDRVDAMSALYAREGMLLARYKVLDALAIHRGEMFAPHLFEVLAEIAQRESFWLFMEPGHLGAYFRPWLVEGRRHPIDFSTLHAIAGIFSNIVDAKSPYTAAHSAGVGSLARFLGVRMGLDGDRCDLLEIAGLLHDLGKLRVPDEILEKNGGLTPEERTKLARHSFDSYSILAPIEGLEEVALWSAMHHEKVSGGGYPFHSIGAQIPLEARILAVADVFQALAQDRPYRRSLAPEVILPILHEMVADRHLDGDVVQIVAGNLGESWHFALPVEGATIQGR